MCNEQLLPVNMLVLDRSSCLDEPDVLYPFALEELLCRAIGQGAPPVLHIWRHPRAFVMGLRDSRLPHAAAAARDLASLGYQTAVRNSGGAAVPLDPGVVNVSLLLPKAAGDMEHRKDFELMVAFIRQALLLLTDRVEQGEVEGSFCPGEFDLSVKGRKFCGIAQRRQQHALAVQAFVIVAGEGVEKAQTARAFYDQAACGAAPGDYPLVAENSMASLSESLGLPLAAERFIDAVHQLCKEQGILEQASAGSLQTLLPTDAEIRLMADQLRERYGIQT